MKLLIVLLALLVGPWGIVFVFHAIFGRWLIDELFAGRLGIALLFLLTGSGHFFLTQPMVSMLPKWVPGRVLLVYVTGVIELAAALLVLFATAWRVEVGWGLILMLAAFLPVNIYAAINRIPIGGHEQGLRYLAVRIPAQLFMAGWIWWFCIR